jgi:hypothetical protein
MTQQHGPKSFLNACIKPFSNSVLSSHSVHIQRNALDALSTDESINVVTAIIQIAQVVTSTVSVIGLLRVSTPSVKGSIRLHSLGGVICSVSVSIL